MAEPRLTRIARRTYARVWPGYGKTITLRSTNRLLRQRYPGAIGLKTGFTNRAGHCLVAVIERGARRIAIVLLGSQFSAFADARRIAREAARAGVIARRRDAAQRPGAQDRVRRVRVRVRDRARLRGVRRALGTRPCCARSKRGLVRRGLRWRFAQGDRGARAGVAGAPRARVAARAARAAGRARARRAALHVDLRGALLLGGRRARGARRAGADPRARAARAPAPGARARDARPRRGVARRRAASGSRRRSAARSSSATAGAASSAARTSTSSTTT